MSFPRYPKYKDSGVEWLGEVPEGWETRRIGYYFSERREKVSDKDYRPLSVTMGGIVPQIETAAKTDDSDNRKRVCIGDFVINSRSDRKGSSGVSDLEGSVSLISTVLRPQDTSGVHMPFVHHLLRSVPFQEEFYRNGKGIVADLWSTNYSAMRNILLALPDPAEQTAVAAFLDRETAKIDELIAEQRRLMELLKEKRQAVISHAVTKGLNPDAPMKPSGIEWLGDVPEHWVVIALKRLVAAGTSISYGIVQPGEPLKTGVPFIQTTNMTTGDFDLDNLQKTTHEIADQYPRSQLSGGEVILGIRASIGAAHVVPHELEGANLSRGVARIVPGPQISSAYLVRYFGTESVSRYWQLSKQGSTFNEVSIATVRGLSVCVPPLSEQAEISDQLVSELARFDTLITEAQRAIDLLQERRTALISAAVTGQIDVREEVTS